MTDLPFLVSGTSSIAAVFTPNDQRIFDKVSDNDYESRFFLRDTISVDGAYITLIDSAGNTFEFHPFDVDADSDETLGPDDAEYWKQGKIHRITTASGHVISFMYDGQGRLETASRVLGNGVTESYHYEYVNCLLYTSPSPRDRQKSRMPSSA